MLTSAKRRRGSAAGYNYFIAANRAAKSASAFISKRVPSVHVSFIYIIDKQSFAILNLIIAAIT